MGFHLSFVLFLFAVFVHISTQQCPSINPVPDNDPWYMRLPTIGFGGIQVTHENGFTDVYLNSPLKNFQVGVRLDWGASIFFFGEANEPTTNVLDMHDTGREVQIALYDADRLLQPCASNATCADPNAASCGYTNNWLGWDPVQGGDRCGNGAKVLSFSQMDDTLQVVVQPIQWNPDWDQTTCYQGDCTPQPVSVTYTIDLRFVNENIVEVALEVTSQESYSHAIGDQEFPCMYASFGQNGAPDMVDLLDSSGNIIPLSPGDSPAAVLYFNSTQPWVAFQDAGHDYGVGFTSDQGIHNWVGIKGNPQEYYYHYARALNHFSINAGGSVKGISYLTLGNYPTISGLYDEVLAKRPPFGTVDVPAYGNTTYSPGSSVSVEGWALSSVPISYISFEVDGVSVGTSNATLGRTDVCQVFPGYTTCPYVGYSFSLSTSSLSSSCSHLLRVYAFDANGNSQRLGDRVLVPS